MEEFFSRAFNRFIFIESFQDFRLRVVIVVLFLGNKERVVRHHSKSISKTVVSHKSLVAFNVGEDFFNLVVIRNRRGKSTEVSVVIPDFVAINNAFHNNLIIHNFIYYISLKIIKINAITLALLVYVLF